MLSLQNVLWEGLTSVKGLKEDAFQVSEVVPHENDITNAANGTLHKKNLKSRLSKNYI